MYFSHARGYTTFIFLPSERNPLILGRRCERLPVCISIASPSGVRMSAMKFPTGVSVVLPGVSSE
ncbi:MAG: hypothetical protein II584_00315 [Treponema sp.]|nr:hypothetical protein [Treponema sp.]